MAGRIASSAPEEEPQAAGRWLRGLRFSGFSAIMLGVLVLAVVVLAPTLKIFADQRAQITELEAGVAETEALIEQVRGERERWNDTTFIMTQARERLYYVMPGEVSYLVVNDLETPVDPRAQASISPDLQATESDWMGTLLASIMTAGLAPDVEAVEPGATGE